VGPGAAATAETETITEPPETAAAPVLALISRLPFDEV
jgi:hypothetical protein